MSRILANSFKDKSGIKRFIFQFPMLSFGVLSIFTLYYFIKRKNITLLKIRKYILISTIIAVIYGVIEIIYLLDIVDTSKILIKVSSYIQLYARGEVYERGVRSVTGEASYFAMYAAFVLPWIFSYI
ncbi:hypothetical protein H9X77_13695, partial [Clostridium saudiense]|nr:hypothetical protein [Clostridium saudiense]